MENLFSHELVSVIKRACFARHGSAVRPSLLILGVNDDPLLQSVLTELSLDSTLSTSSIATYDDALLQRSLLTTTVVLSVATLSRTSAGQIAAHQTSLLEWERVKRDACPLFWPAQSVMDFFIVNQDSSVSEHTKTFSPEGKDQ